MKSGAKGAAAFRDIETQVGKVNLKVKQSNKLLDEMATPNWRTESVGAVGIDKSPFFFGGVSFISLTPIPWYKLLILPM